MRRIERGAQWIFGVVVVAALLAACGGRSPSGEAADGAAGDAGAADALVTLDAHGADAAVGGDSSAPDSATSDAGSVSPKNLLYIREVSGQDQLFVARWDGSDASQLSSFVPGSIGIRSMAPAPDGRRVALGDGKGIFVFDRQSKKLEALPLQSPSGGAPPTWGWPGYLADGDLRWSPDGKRLAIGAKHANYAFVPALHLVDAAGGVMATISMQGESLSSPDQAGIKGPLYSYGFAWSHDARRLFVLTSLGLSVLTPAAQTVVQIAKHKDSPFNTGIVVSPAGDRIAVLENRSCQPKHCTDIYLLNVDGTGRRRASKSDTPKRHLVFDASGRYLVWERTRGFGVESDGLWRLDLQSGQERRIVAVGRIPSR